MQTLITGLVLTLVAVVCLVLSGWQDSSARRAGEQAADASLRGLQHRREGADHAAEELDDTEASLLGQQRRHAARAYALKRVSIVLLAVGLLGVVGGSLALLS